MKKLVMGLMIILGVVGFGTMVHAETRPVDLALFSPVELFPATDDVTGVRLVFIYGVKQNFTGLDLGLVKVTKGDWVGVGIGGHKVGGNAKGIQYGLFNYVEGDFTGWQHGLANYSFGETTGLQTGIYNRGGHFVGLQLGLVNRVRLLGGVQIGLLNFQDDAEKGDWTKDRAFFPIINAKF